VNRALKFLMFAIICSLAALLVRVAIFAPVDESGKNRVRTPGIQSSIPGGSSDAGPSIYPCLPGELLAAAVQQGLNPGVVIVGSRSVLLTTADDGLPIYVMAALVTTGLESGKIATWWVVGATPDNIRTISAVNHVARSSSDWGAAAQPGSTSYNTMRDLEDSEQHAAVVACVAEENTVVGDETLRQPNTQTQASSIQSAARWVGVTIDGRSVEIIEDDVTPFTNDGLPLAVWYLDRFASGPMACDSLAQQIELNL